MKTTEPKAEAQAGRDERRRWIKRFRGHFGDPMGIDEYNTGRITFRDMYDRSIRYAEQLVAEVQYIQSQAFDYEH